MNGISAVDIQHVYRSGVLFFSPRDYKYLPNESFEFFIEISLPLYLPHLSAKMQRSSVIKRCILTYSSGYFYGFYGLVSTQWDYSGNKMEHFIFLEHNNSTFDFERLVITIEIHDSLRSYSCLRTESKWLPPVSIQNLPATLTR